MQVASKPDHPLEDAACKAATGKTLAEWFQELDAIDALKLGRRETINRIYAGIEGTDAWWPTTLAVEYEKHKGIAKKDGLPEGYTICCTKSIAAPVERTYAAWTDPQGFATFFCANGSQEPSEGGAIVCGCGCKGSFLRVRPNKDLRFTWEHPGATAPMTVDVQFQDNKGKTLMNVMTSRIQTRAEADGLRDAWGEALNRLKGLVEETR
jgi:uncharacterized protein YndB with AHSA1/START domain